MTTTVPLRAGVIGLGVGAHHARAYEDEPRATLVALCDLDRTVLAEVGSHHRDVRTTTDAEEILNDPDIDVVSIASYDDDHHRHVVTSIRHGKHVLVEKPLCTHVDELRDIVQALDRHPNVVLTSNLVLRREPRLLRLRERIRRGDLGAVYYIEGSYDYGRLSKILDGWRGRNPNYSVMHGGGIHIIDQQRWLTSCDITRVFAVASPIPSQVFDFEGTLLSSAALSFAGGAVGHVTANFASATRHHHRLTVFGTEGTFVQGHTGAAYYFGRGSDLVEELVEGPYPVAPKGSLVGPFVRCILDGDPLDVSAADVVATMEASLAIEQSLERDEPVTVRARAGSKEDK